MPLSNKTYSIIVPSANANLTGHTYGQVYADQACAPTINGVTINMVAGGTLDIVVRTISSTTGCFLLGDPINPSYASVIIG